MADGIEVYLLSNLKQRNATIYTCIYDEEHHVKPEIIYYFYVLFLLSFIVQDDIFYETSFIEIAGTLNWCALKASSKGSC